MTDKEWLEDLKDQYHFYVEKGIAFNLEHNDIERLFMQVERVQELEVRNVRYREALEFYGDKKNYEISSEKTYIGHGDFAEETWIEVDRDRGKKARQALRGESTIRALEVKQDSPDQGWF